MSIQPPTTDPAATSSDPPDPARHRAPLPKALVLDYGGVLAADGYCPPSPQAVEVVRALSARGIPLVLASNTARTQPPGIRTEQLRAAGILDAFAVLLASEEIGYGKPDPRFFRLVRKALAALVPHAAPHEIVWVEDSDRRGVAPAVQYDWNAAWVGGDQHDRLAAVPGVSVIATIADLPSAVGLDL